MRSRVNVRLCSREKSREESVVSSAAPSPTFPVTRRFSSAPSARSPRPPPLTSLPGGGFSLGRLRVSWTPAHFSGRFLHKERFLP